MQMMETIIIWNTPAIIKSDLFEFFLNTKK